MRIARNSGDCDCINIHSISDDKERPFVRADRTRASLTERRHLIIKLTFRALPSGVDGRPLRFRPGGCALRGGGGGGALAIRPPLVRRYCCIAPDFKTALGTHLHEFTARCEQQARHHPSFHGYKFSTTLITQESCTFPIDINTSIHVPSAPHHHRRPREVVAMAEFHYDDRVYFRLSHIEFAHDHRHHSGALLATPLSPSKASITAIAPTSTNST